MHTQTCISTWLVHPQTNPHLCFQHSWTMMACPGTTSPLHSLKSSPSLCLGYTLTHTQTHLATLKNILTYILFSSCFFSLQSFVSIPPPPPQLPSPSFSCHVSLVTPFKLSYSLREQEPWHLYNHLRSFSRPYPVSLRPSTAKKHVSLSLCLPSIHTTNTTSTTNPQKLKYMKIFSKGSFSVCSATYVICHMCSVTEQAAGVKRPLVFLSNMCRCKG